MLPRVSFLAKASPRTRLVGMLRRMTVARHLALAYSALLRGQKDTQLRLLIRLPAQPRWRQWCESHAIEVSRDWTCLQRVICESSSGGEGWAFLRYLGTFILLQSSPGRYNWCLTRRDHSNSGILPTPSPIQACLWPTQMQRLVWSSAAPGPVSRHQGGRGMRSE